MAKARIKEKHPTFAANLRFWRLQRGMTQDQLADASGFSQQSIGNFEMDRHMPPYDGVARIAAGLRLPVVYLWHILPCPRDQEHRKVS